MLAAGVFAVLMCGGAAAQNNPPQPNAPSNAPAACPPDVKNGPTVGSGNANPNLSDKLAESKGVICPPAGVDPEIRVPPRQGGDIIVIPPPGSPGGDPTVQPK
jgi:hypothetical protein